MDDLKSKVDQLVKEQQKQKNDAKISSENQHDYCLNAIKSERLPDFRLYDNKLTYEKIEQLRKIKSFLDRLVNLIDDSAWFCPNLEIDPDKFTANIEETPLSRYTHMRVGIPKFYYRYIENNGRIELDDTSSFAFSGQTVRGTVKTTGLFQTDKKKFIQAAVKSVESFRQKALAPYEYIIIRNIEEDDKWTACIFKDGCLMTDRWSSGYDCERFFSPLATLSGKAQEDMLVRMAAGIITNKGSVTINQYQADLNTVF